MEKERICPACGRNLGTEIHRAMAFEVAPGNPQIKSRYFWICDSTIDGLEQLVKIYRTSTLDKFVNIP